MRSNSRLFFQSWVYNSDYLRDLPIQFQACRSSDFWQCSLTALVCNSKTDVLGKKKPWRKGHTLLTYCLVSAGVQSNHMSCLPGWVGLTDCSATDRHAQDKRTGCMVLCATWHLGPCFCDFCGYMYCITLWLNIV